MQQSTLTGDRGQEGESQTPVFLSCHQKKHKEELSSLQGSEKFISPITVNGDKPFMYWQMFVFFF